MQTHVQIWSSAQQPTETVLRQLMESEGLRPYAWSNAPRDVYEAHTHPYNKVIYCVSGLITFGLPDEKHKLTLHPGDRLELPAGTLHEAFVGDEGVECLEAHL